jgi:phosphoglycerate kinase
MKTLRDIPALEGVKVLLRADFNVPIRNGKVADDFRIRMALPTIQFLTERDAKVILVSHLESADGKKPSLAPVAEHLQGLGQAVTFVKQWKSAAEVIEHDLANGQCILLENLRDFPGEEKNDASFAGELASLADIYVNEAFSVSHRRHASIVGVPAHIPAYAGLQLEKEVASLSRAFKPEHPFVFVLGGAKFETKLPLVERFSKEADTVFIGGALANDALKAKGFPVGISKVSDGKIDISGIVSRTNVLIPADVVTQDGSVKDVSTVGAQDKILDAGPKTLSELKNRIAAAKFVLWNGPLGLYEDGYRSPTLKLAKYIAEATARGAETIVGGGDTLAAIAELGLTDKYSFISTGGGAMLDFLAEGTLVGIEALDKSEA